MVKIVKIDENMFISAQIQPEDIPAIAAAGVRHIVNNRPDGEDPAGQPFSLEIEAAAKEVGIPVVNIPFTAQTLTSAEVAEFAAILEKGGGPILAFCRSGNRSAMLWAAANVAVGASLESVVQKAGNAGYDLRGAGPFIYNLGKMAGLK
jgi:uncharacterized protein (TIGR01244 family)